MNAGIFSGLAHVLWRHSEPMAWCLRIVVAMICLGFVVPHLTLAATKAQVETGQMLERRVKAAFIFRFTEFITWPETAFRSPDQPFLIGVAGSDSFVEELRQVVLGKQVAGRPVQIRRLKENDAWSGDHLIFISNEERRRLPQFARTVLPGALIVTEWEGAIAQGSVINFVLAGDRVRFEIALNAAERLNLQLSSRLLAVALAVHGTP